MNHEPESSPDSAMVERALNEAADLIAATLAQPTDPRAWDQLLIYCPLEAIERRWQMTQTDDPRYDPRQAQGWRSLDEDPSY